MVDYSITLCYSNYALRMKYEFDYSRKQGYLRHFIWTEEAINEIAVA